MIDPEIIHSKKLKAELTGDPKLTEQKFKDTRVRRLVIRLSQKEWDQLEETAEESGKSKSVYVREKLFLDEPYSKKMYKMLKEIKENMK